MANERLWAALSEAGIEPDELARQVGVDVKTVGRWLAGTSVPYRRHRASLARALSSSEEELWPDAAGEQDEDDPRHEILGAWPQASDLRATDWRVLLRGASEHVDLLTFRLAELLRPAGVVESLAAKGAGGCRIRVLLPVIDSSWLALTARELQTGEEDFVGRSALEREIELALGYLQPLLGLPGIDARAFYGDLFPLVLRFDSEMLVTQRLAAEPDGQGPLLHLRRHHARGLVDQFSRHLEMLHRAAMPLRPDPDLYPDPRMVPERYQPVTEKTYASQAAWVDHQVRQYTPTNPLNDVRQRLREPGADGS
jgi:hypothetical protein